MDTHQVAINPSRPLRLATIASLFFFILLILSEISVAQPSELTSPNGRYKLRILDRALPGIDPYFGDCTLVLVDGNHVLLKIPTTGYLINALWSPDGNYVAVNNRRGNSGDYVWVFSLAQGKALKKPDDTSFPFPHHKITEICSNCDEASVDKDLTIAKGWKSTNELEVETRWRFYKTALIVRDAVYKVSGQSVTFAEERFRRHPVDWLPTEK